MKYQIVELGGRKTDADTFDAVIDHMLTCSDTHGPFRETVGWDEPEVRAYLRRVLERELKNIGDHVGFRHAEPADHYMFVHYDGF